MKKIELAYCLTDFYLWDGIKDPYKLAKRYTKGELQDMYDMMKEAEEEYWENRR